MPRKITHIIDLEDILSTHRRKLVALCFYQPQNEDCDACYNSLKTLESSYKGRAIVCLVDAEKFYHLTAEYEVMDYPTVAFIKNRTLVGKYCGTNENHLSVLFSMHSAPSYFTLFQHESKGLRWPGPYEEDEPDNDLSTSIHTVIHKIYALILRIASMFMGSLAFITMLAYKRPDYD